MNSIRIKDVWRKLYGRKRLFIKVWIIVFVLSCAYILPQPRFYTAEVLLAPEVNSQDALGGLSSIASSFGFNLGSGGSTDAIYPELYPDLMSSNDFIVGLFDIPVKTVDGEIETDLYTYESECQKTAFYNIPLIWVKKKMAELTADDDQDAGTGRKVNPFHLTKKQDALVEKLKGDIFCIVDAKTSCFRIRVTSQDPLVSATLADSVSAHLQSFITDYRTSKARKDFAYYESLVDTARKEYQQALEKYSSYCDAHQNIILQSFISERDELENDMALKYNAYTVMTTQLQTARAKIQESTPAFTVLQNASVPVRPSGPKRMIFVAGMLVLSTIVLVGYLLRSELFMTVKFFGKENAS